MCREIGMQCVIVVFPDHTILVFFMIITNLSRNLPKHALHFRMSIG